MRRRILASIPILLALFALARPALAQAPPSVPAARFYGLVTLGGYVAPAGTPLLAQGANGAYCGSGTVAPDGSYSMDIQPAGSCLGTIVFFVNGQPADQPGFLTNTLSGAIALNLSVSGPYYGAYGPPQPPYSGVTGSVTYQPGWNLVGLPPSSLISPSNGVLFTWQPGDGAYETLAGGSPQAGYGYWAYFSTPTTVTLPLAPPRSMRRMIAPGQIAMVGNPFNGPATISGATSVFTYDPVYGYQQTTVLQPGQGAWVLSAGGVVVITAGQAV